ISLATACSSVTSPSGSILTSHDPARSPPTHWLQSGCSAPAVDGLSPFPAAPRCRRNSEAVTRPRRVHGRLARGQSGHSAAQFDRRRCRALGLCATTCEYGCSLQHHCLLLAAAARTHSPVGQFAVAGVDAHRTRSYLPLVHS